MSTCNRLDLGTLGHRLIMSKNLPNYLLLLMVPFKLLGPHTSSIFKIFIMDEH